MKDKDLRAERIHRKRGMTVIEFSPTYILRLQISVKKHQYLSDLHKFSKTGLTTRKVLRVLHNDDVKDKHSNKNHQDTPQSKKVSS
jgi:hypothetical protein